MEHIKTGLIAARATAAAPQPPKKLHESSKSRLLKALRAGIPFDEALFHARTSEIAYFRALEVEPTLEHEVERAQMNPIMRARATILREIQVNPHAAARFLEEETQISELERLRALTVD